MSVHAFAGAIQSDHGNHGEGAEKMCIFMCKFVLLKIANSTVFTTS